MTKTNEPKNRRRNYFIKMKFQSSFILKFCLLLLLACVIMGTVSYLLTKKTTTTSFEGLRLTAKSTSDFILPVLASSSLMAVVLVTFATILVVLFISHRIAGPLYRIEKTVAEIGKGNLSAEVHLRRSDEIKALADIINEAVRNMRSPLSYSRSRLNDLEKDITAVKTALSKKGVPEDEISRIIGPAEIKIKEIREGLSFFKLTCLVLLFMMTAYAAQATVVSEGEFQDGNDWSSVKSIYCTIFFKGGVDIDKINEKIDTYRIDYGLTEKPGPQGSDAEGEIAYKFDLIFLKVQEILDMRPRDLYIKVRIYRGQDDLDRVYIEIFGQKNNFIAYYIFKLNTLFSSQEKISANVLAHEIAHCVVDHYFSVIPPTKVAEMIAQYADVHLRD